MSTFLRVIIDEMQKVNFLVQSIRAGNIYCFAASGTLLKIFIQVLIRFFTLRFQILVEKNMEHILNMFFYF